MDRYCYFVPVQRAKGKYSLAFTERMEKTFEVYYNPYEATPEKTYLYKSFIGFTTSGKIVYVKSEKWRKMLCFYG